MAVYRRGSRGSGVESLQKSLNDAGYKPPLKVDGVFGTLTDRAVRWYQRTNSLKIDGIVGPETFAKIGKAISSDDPEGKTVPGSSPLSNRTDYTDPEETRFNGLPGKPELWKDSDTNDVFIVYYVPNSEPPIPMLFRVPSADDEKAFHGDKAVRYDREIPTKTIDSYGSIRWGTTDDIPATGGDPWTGFVDKFERAKETQPWLNDPEVFATYAAAWLQGREPERWELESTDWWQTHTEAEREWAWLSARNPAEAERVRDDNYIETYNAFVELGLDTVSDELVKWMSDKYTEGSWSQSELRNQVLAIFDPAMTDDIDSELKQFMTQSDIQLDDPNASVSSVKAEWRRWLGPVYQPTDDQVQEWAARIRRGGEGARDALTEHLRGQRKAMYGQYEDDSLTYEDIAQPWRSFATQQWGQQIDETSDTFQQLIKLNDVVEGGKLLRRKGIEEGVAKVKQDAMTGLASTTSSVRRAI